MSNEEFYNKVAELFKNKSLTEVEIFLENTLEEAIKTKNTSLILACLNELTGFYRDLTKYDISLKYALAIIPILTANNLLNTNAHFISLINIANIYRQNSEYDKSIAYSKEALNIYKTNNITDEKNLAALYNNLGLTYLEDNQLDNAYQAFNSALTIIKNFNDSTKIGTTIQNMAVVRLKQENYLECSNLLNEAVTFFKEKDIHYSGLMNTMGGYYFAIKDYHKALEAYYEASSYLIKTTGFSKSYQAIQESIKDIYKILNISPLKGLDLANNYYNEFVKERIESLPLNIKNKIAVGLFGAGSECYYLDDEISKDHDFDMDIIILTTDDITNSEYETLQNLYNSLPKAYLGYYKLNLSKKGLFKLSDYLKRYDLTLDSIKNADYVTLAELTNGRIFYDCGFFTKLRDEIKGIINDNYLEEIIRLALKFNQQAIYNYQRLLKRNDILSAKYVLNQSITTLINFIYLINLTPYPHDKLKLKLLKNLKYANIGLNYTNAILNNIDINKAISEANEFIIYALHKENLIKKINSNYIEDYKEEIIKNYPIVIEQKKLIKEIIEVEFLMLGRIKNEGGRANCQDNPKYFALMRKSQYLTWNIEMLKSYLNDLYSALKDGRNLMQEKYIQMEVYRDKDFYDKLKYVLPNLTTKRIALQEEIIKIQIEHLLEFNRKNPDITKNMRKIYTTEDDKYGISYETYLRGEISTYSDNTLILYAKYIINMDKNNDNVTKEIITNSFYFLNDEKL